MRILLINHFPLTGSGSGVYTANIAKSLKEEDNQICVIIPENITQIDEIEGVKLHPVYFKNEEEIKGQLPFNFPCFTTHPRSHKSFQDLSDQELKLYEEAFREAIKKEVEEFKPDIIHCGHIWILASIASEFDIPLIITAHGTDLMGYQQSERFRKYADNAVEYCKKIITISKDSNELVLNTFPNSNSKVSIIQNGYNTDVFFKEKYDKKQVLKELNIDGEYNKVVSFVGKLTEFKGVDVLIKAAKKYEDDDTLTIIAGNGKLYEELNNLVDSLNLKNIKFIGNQPQDILRKIYNIADVSVVPSRREPFGLVAIEAMACGTPVVGTNQGGIPDFLKSDVGILVDVEDDEMLAKAITDILEKRKKFDSDYIAQCMLENYSQKKLIKNLIREYESVELL